MDVEASKVATMYLCNVSGTPSALAIEQCDTVSNVFLTSRDTMEYALPPSTRPDIRAVSLYSLECRPSP
jgi:hypothetical protein